MDARIFTGRSAEARKLLLEGRTEQALEGLRSALSLWRGPVLGGLDRPALQAKIAALDERRLAAMEHRVEAELEMENHQSILGDLSVWVAEHPLRERLVAQFMMALHRSGAQARALMVFDRTRRLLKEELGVSPGAELREAHRRILDGVPHTVRKNVLLRTHNNLPPVAAHFTGRAREIHAMHEAGAIPGANGHATRSSPAVIAIDGMAGIGKTTLALQSAHQLARFYPDAKVYVDMQAHATADRPRDPCTALGMLLSGLGVTPENIPGGLEERVALWRRLLADRRALIVLDNVADTHQALPLLPTALGCLTVVTSRNRLTDLIATCHLTLQEMSRAEGQELFGKIVGDDRPLREPVAVEYVVDLCGGIPLAIRLAAAKLRHRPSWTTSYLASRLAARRHWMSTLTADGDSLTEVFHQSYKGLSAAQQRVFRLLGQLTLDRITPRGVAELAGLPLARAEQLLESLVDAHLLIASEPTRYGIHELVHAYAAQLVDETRPQHAAHAEESSSTGLAVGGEACFLGLPDLGGAA